MVSEGQIEACPRNVRERAAVRPGSPVGVVKAEALRVQTWVWTWRERLDELQATARAQGLLSG